MLGYQHELFTIYLYQGYHLYFDNFYTSPSLCQQLLESAILSCGTMRVNRRGLPEDIKPAPRDGFRQGDILFWKCGSLTAVHWKDKRAITAISTLHGNDVTIIPARRDEQTGVQNPTMIVDYNSHIGGICQTCRVCGYQHKADGKKSQKESNNFCITCKTYMHRSNCWNLWHSKAFQSTSSFNLTLPELYGYCCSIMALLEKHVPAVYSNHLSTHPSIKMFPDNKDKFLIYLFNAGNSVHK